MKIYKETLDTMLGIVRNYTQQTTDMEIERRVYDIIADVRANGDAALKAYSEKIRWCVYRRLQGASRGNRCCL